MKKFLPVCGILVAVVAGAQSPAPSSAPDKVATPGKSTNPAEENPILRGAPWKTEWQNVRNPFRFEVSESRHVEAERFEQMQVLGYTRMPDDAGVLRTYAFVTKTSERKDEKKGKAAEVVKETYVLESLPEIVNESTIPTEEQTENSSISLTSEQLWFLGVVVGTNKQAVAVFWPYGSYPVKEDSLRLFDIQDRLKELPIRVTKGGEKIGGSGRPITVLSKRNSKLDPAAPTAPPAAVPSQPTDSPASKPINGNVGKVGQNTVDGEKPTPAASSATIPRQNTPSK